MCFRPPWAAAPDHIMEESSQAAPKCFTGFNSITLQTVCSTDDTFIASRGSETALEAVACGLCETA